MTLPVGVVLSIASNSFSIVGSAEADPASGLISDDSPIGKALLGKKANRAKDIEVQTPQGVALFRILKIL